MADRMDEPSQSTSSQAGQSQTQDSSKKITLKKDATMRILDVCNDDKGELIIKMSWNLPMRNIYNKRAILNFQDLYNDKAQVSIFRQLGCPVFVETKGNQKKRFTQFIEGELENWEDTRNSDNDENYVDTVEVNKVCLSLSEMDVHKFDNKYYFISGEDSIFLLNEGGEYSKKLSEREIEDLGFTVSWQGPSIKTEFSDSDEKAVEALISIIDNYTSMVGQDEFHGFAVASLVTHLRGYLYQHILAERRDFYSSITLSGDKKGTGKSLMFTLNQLLLYGREITPDKHITEANMYNKLSGDTDHGKIPIYANEWDNKKGGTLFNSAVKGLWDGGCWSTRTGDLVPKTVLLVNANATPDDLKFQPGVESKVCIISTPTESLKHERKMEITKKMVKKAADDHIFLPGYLGLAVKTLIQKVTDLDLLFYKEELQEENDEREGQIYKDFDSFANELKDALDKFSLPLKPPIFDKEPDHTCLSYYNRNKQSKEDKLKQRDERRKIAANSLISYLKENNRLSCLSHRKGGVAGFKIVAMDNFPINIHSEYMMSTQTYVTTDENRRIRVRFIPMEYLSQDNIDIVVEFLSSFQHLYTLTLKKQEEKSLSFSMNFLQMITNSCTLYEREQADIRMAKEQSLGVTDEFADIMDNVDGAEDAETMEIVLTCGVFSCPKVNKVWPTKERLEQHRSTTSHKKAAKRAATCVDIPPGIERKRKQNFIN